MKDKFIVTDMELQLVQKAIQGDVDSFTELCKRYYPAMVAIAHSILGDRHLAEDAAQETFAKAAFGLAQLRRKAKFAGWLAAICRNQAKNMYRRTENIHEIKAAFRPDVSPEQNDLTECVRDAIRRLKIRDRELIYLRYYEGMAYEQISGVFGISEQAINGRLRRAKRKIQTYLIQNGFREVKL